MKTRDHLGWHQLAPSHPWGHSSCHQVLTAWQRHVVQPGLGCHQ